MSRLWEPISLGDLTLKNRLVMAPMTRSRAAVSGAPTEINALYYAQRSSMGLQISEGTQPSADGQGYLLTPGIYTEEHVRGWKLVTDRVHEAGGHIFIQLMHVGRIAHPDNTPHGRQPVGPSAVRPSNPMYTPTGLKPMPVPRALETGEIAQTIRDHRHAAAMAVAAGADGVEIHGANGYLIHQFLSDNANRRTDAYGGSIANRVRFAVEVAAAVAEEIGPARTGLRIAPGNPFNDIVEESTDALYHRLIQELAPLELAYLHVIQGDNETLLRWIRENWPTRLIVNRRGRPREAIATDVDSGLADMASVGAIALANPDLPRRLEIGAPLNTPNSATFYTGGSLGYTDYPTLEDSAAQ